MTTKIIPFKKGEPVPEWLFRCNLPRCDLVFLADVKVVKYSNLARVYPDKRTLGVLIPVESLQAATDSIGTIDMIDRRPLWLKAWHRMRGRKIRFFGKPTEFLNHDFKTRYLAEHRALEVHPHKITGNYDLKIDLEKMMPITCRICGKALVWGESIVMGDRICARHDPLTKEIQ